MLKMLLINIVSKLTKTLLIDLILLALDKLEQATNNTLNNDSLKTIRAALLVTKREVTMFRNYSFKERFDLELKEHKKLLQIEKEKQEQVRE